MGHLDMPQCVDLLVVMLGTEASRIEAYAFTEAPPVPSYTRRETPRDTCTTGAILARLRPPWPANARTTDTLWPDDAPPLPALVHPAPARVSQRGASVHGRARADLGGGLARASKPWTSAPSYGETLWPPSICGRRPSIWPHDSWSSRVRHPPWGLSRGPAGARAPEPQKRPSPVL